MSNIKKIAKGTAIYSITYLLQKGVNFLLLPLFAIYFTAQDFGILGTVQALTGFLDILILLGLNSAATRFYYHYRQQSPDKIPEVWATLYGISISAGCIVLLLCTTIARPLITWLLNGIPYQPYFLYGAIGSFFMALFTIYLASMQAREKSTQYACFNLFFMAIQIILTLFFVSMLKQHAEGPLLSRLLTFAIFFPIFLWVTRQEIKWTFNKKIVIEVLVYIFPLGIHMLGGWSQSALDRVILNRVSNTETVGVFQLAVQIAFPLTALTGALISAAAPWMTRNILNAPENYRKRMIEITPLFFSMIAIAFLLFLEFSKWAIVKFFDAKFAGGIPILGFLILGHFLQMYYLIFIQPLFVVEGGSKKIPQVSIPAALLQSCLLFMLVPSMRSMGCSIAFATGMGFMSLFSFWFSQKCFPIKWKKTILLPAFLFITYLTLSHFNPQLKWVFFVAIVLGLVGFSAKDLRRSFSLFRDMVR